MSPPESSDEEALVGEARALLERSRPAEAARILRTHLQRHPGTASVYMPLGVALSESGEGLMALETLQQAVALEPENAVAHYNLGQAYRESGREQEALAEWERALQLRPDYPAATRAIAEARRHRAAPLAPPGARSSPSPLPESAAHGAPLAPSLLMADEIIRRERDKTPRGMIAVLTVLTLGLIGLLVQPYVPARAFLAIFILEGTVVLPLVMWCVFWLQIQSLRRKEEAALRRGDTFDAAVAKADRRRYEWLGRWY
jgi:tetratricopeptide (TPR) repeat protein